MNWEKLKPNHFYKDPIYIYSSTLFDTKEYDVLYENQNNLSHHSWQDFDKKYRTGFEFKNSIDDVDTQKEVICLWFFKERNDNTISHVAVDDKKVEYAPNTFLVTQSKNIKLITGKRNYIRHPLVQLDLSLQRFNLLFERFNEIL